MEGSRLCHLVVREFLSEERQRAETTLENHLPQSSVPSYPGQQAAGLREARVQFQEFFVPIFREIIPNAGSKVNSLIKGTC